MPKRELRVQRSQERKSQPSSPATTPVMYQLRKEPPREQFDLRRVWIAADRETNAMFSFLYENLLEHVSKAMNE